MKVGYAYLYPEGEQFLHVGPLGEGGQGTVSLVYGTDTKKLYVRKAATYDLQHYGDEAEWSPEVANYRQHPNINELIAFQHHDVDEDAAHGIHATMIHNFCNGGDLCDFLNSFEQRGEIVPEGLIWRFIHQILAALNFLRRENSPAIDHGDLYGPNILVNWPPRATPNFILADLGLSTAFDLEVHADIRPLRLIQDTQAADSFRQDMRDLSALMYLLMTGDPDDRRCLNPKNQARADQHYSSQLMQVADALVERADDLQCDINYDNIDIVELVRKKANARGNGEHLLRELVRPSLKKLTPLVFDSYEELMSQVTRPPGPWYGVKVDQKTFEVLETLDGPFCADTVHYTSQAGMRMKIRVVPVNVDAEADSMQY